MSNEKDFKIENEKIIIKSNDELIDIIRKIEKSKADKIVLTFTEHSDILVSPINFKVLQDKSDGLNKSLIAQIMQNPIGIRNAQQANMSTTDSPAIIPDEEWTIAHTKMIERQKERNSKLKATSHKVSKVQPKDDFEQKEKENIETPIKEDVKPQEDSAFTKSVEAAINRSKQELKEGKQKVIEEGGVVLALGEDIANKKELVKETKTVVEKPKSLIGRDFKELTSVEQGLDLGVEQSMEEKAVDRKKRKSFLAPILKMFAALGAWFALLPVKIAKAGAKKSTKIIFWRIGFPIIVLLVFSGWLAYRMLPLVKVDMYIESKSVEVSKTFTGDSSVTILDLEKNEVPVKKETVSKSRADNTSPTGIAYRGEKADGIANFKFWGYSPGIDPITIPAGTVITSTDGLAYETTNALILGEEVGGSVVIFKDAAVRAVEVGEEYNISSGISFSVGSFDEATVTAESSGAFTGGSKEEYTVLAQQDVDDVVDILEKDAFKDAEEELDGLATGDWVIIESTIKSEQTGDITTDIPVGAEADIVNISIKTESTALYYKQGAIESEVKQMLSNAAIEQNLFESDTEIELKLDEDIAVAIDVTEVSGEVVTVSLTTSGRIQMEVNKEKIVEDLKGLSWDDGNLYLGKIGYVAKATEVKFLPESFPEFLRHYPDRNGRIIVKVNEIEVTEVE